MGNTPDIEKENNPYELSNNQVHFCQLYAMGEYRGHGVKCYSIAYDIDTTQSSGYNTCKSNASQLLTNANILSYIRELFEDKDLNDTIVDNELAYVIKQNADFGSKVAAIKEYNQLKARITKKLELSQSEGVKVILGKEPEKE